MRIAALGFNHESNTFAPVAATLESWIAEGMYTGDDLRRRSEGSESTMGGFLRLAQEDSAIDVVPVMFALNTPRGPSTAEAFEYLCNEMLGALDRSGPWDAVLLAQHGAAVAEGFSDADGEFIRRVRGAVGEGVPVGVTLDMHANVSQQMVDHCDVVTVYQTNPHVDAADQGLSCARIIADMVRGRVRPCTVLIRLPLVINILRQGTSDEPLRSVLLSARRAEEHANVLSVSVVEGFPYSDVAEMGVSVVVVCDADRLLAEMTADALAAELWAVRADLQGAAATPEDALREALTLSATPVVLADTGDNVWGGGPGDSTHLLHAARAVGARGVGISIVDPAVVDLATATGVGSRISTAVGGKTDTRHGAPFGISGTVIALSDGRFEDRRAHGGYLHFDLGPTVGIRTDDGFMLSVHTLPISTVSVEQFRISGIEPALLRIIIAKGVHSWRAGFAEFAGDAQWVATPGATTADLSLLDYRHRERAIYPFEDDAEWGIKYEQS